MLIFEFIDIFVTNVWRLHEEVDFRALYFQPALNLNRSKKFQVYTSPLMPQNSNLCFHASQNFKFLNPGPPYLGMATTDHYS